MKIFSANNIFTMPAILCSCVLWYFLYSLRPNHVTRNILSALHASTDEPNSRVKTLQTGNRRKLMVYKTIAGYTKTERELHEKFAEKRIEGGEWFQLSKEEVDELNDKEISV